MYMNKMSFTALLFHLMLTVMASVRDPGSAPTDSNSAAGGKKGFVLSDFNKQFFWQKPPEGMFEVDIGLQSQALGKGLPNGANVDLKGQELMQFADVNADMFTDIITIDKARTSVIIHIFD